MLKAGEVGVHPPGALGVAFYVHANAECFIGRGGDGITQPLKDAGCFQLDDHGHIRTIALRNKIFSNLLEAEALDRLPELLFVCCNPDQLILFTGELTRFLEILAERGRLKNVEDIRREVPILLILPNGILSEKTMTDYAEQLHEAILMQRLPDVTEEMRLALLDRVVRGVSLQAGGRRGSGAETIYVHERKGAVVFAGGGDAERERVAAMFTTHDYPFKHAEGVPGTRVEFDKAMISIVLNVGGLIHTVNPDGSLIDLRMGDLCKDPDKQDFVQKITHAVFSTGQAAGAYPPEATYEDIWATHRATILAHEGHVTSSLKTFRDALGAGLTGVSLFSNEEWILTPLIAYAAKAGLKEEERLFKDLKRRVQESMAKAIRHKEQSSAGGAGNVRTSKMKLIGQRNFNIELYEDESDYLVMVGTMLDTHHLIKLELTLFMPDEQITRSRLQMSQVPFPVCREIEPLADRLVGLRIQRGVVNEIGRRVGGHAGCSHIKELAMNLVYFAASNLVGRQVNIDGKSPDERFELTKELLNDSCLAYGQTTAWGLDERIGIKKVGEEHGNPIPLGDYEPSFGVLLRDRSAKWGDKVYLRYCRDEQPQSLSWNEFNARVEQIARHYIELGIRKGDRIGMISENRPEMYMAELAAMIIGAVTVPIFSDHTPQQVTYVLNRAKPRFAIVSGKHQLDKIEKGKHPWVDKFFAMDFDSDCRKWGALDFAELLGDGGAPEEELTARVDGVRPDDLCVIMFTSGTTGAPKGVRLGHRHLISQQKAMSLIWDVNENDVFLNYLPWHHSFGGLFERFMSLYTGAELCLDEGRGKDIDRLIKNWEAFEPTVFFSIPRVHDMLVARSTESGDAEEIIWGGRLRLAFTAGAPLPGHVEAAYREHGIPILEGWGLIEAAPCVTVCTTDRAWRRGCVGFPLPGVKIRINHNQEILAKGPNVMEGYLHDEEATAHMLTEDGWLRTGDLGEITPDGLRLLGRKDGTFKLTTGEKVHPPRIETVLVNESPYISEAVVVGAGKDFVSALIYPDFATLELWLKKRHVPLDQALTDPAVHELYASEIARINPLIDYKFQQVRRATVAQRMPSLDNGELTPSGKLVRKTIISNFKAQIDALFEAEPPPEVIEIPRN